MTKLNAIGALFIAGLGVVFSIGSIISGEYRLSRHSVINSSDVVIGGVTGRVAGTITLIACLIVIGVSIAILRKRDGSDLW